ncbi:MAG: hypothetical protein E7576_07320 [Ruminococcaceae bacterium]|nr:hypothetical protein [Oscillospiraceae bacterium]
MKKDTVLWARQYSKRLITFLLAAWAIGAVIGVIYEFIRLIAAPEMASMDSFYIYLAVPLTCGIPSYVIPNVFLNKEKVRQGYDPAYDLKYLEKEDMTGEGIGEPNEGMETAIEQVSMDI